MLHIVSFSGGMGSFAEAYSCVTQFGKENTKLLFADTSFEDEDLYRFMQDTITFLDCELISLKDGRTPFQVFKDVRYMGNSKVDPCSATLKRNLLIKYITNKYKVDQCNIHLGIDYSEEHRLVNVQARMKPYIYRSTLVEEGVIIPKNFSEKFGIKKPRLYDWGLGHNNCKGFCPKAGLGHYKKVFEADINRYKEFEELELDVYASIGSKYPFLKKTKPWGREFITLKEYRENYLEKEIVTKEEELEFGGCGCAI